MTSTPFTPGSRNTDGHPDVAEISALNEDLLPPNRSSELHAHLADCRLCADVLISLEEIRDSLGLLPHASPMPEDVAERIDAALAAEAMHASPRADGAAVSRETDEAFYDSDSYGKPEREAAPHGRSAAVSRETSAPRRPLDRPAGRPSGGSTGPGRHRPARRVRRWRSAILAGAGAVVALGLGGLVLQSMNGSSPSSAGSGSQASESAQAGGELEKHVHGLLAKRESGESSQGADDSPSRDFKTKEERGGNTPLAGGTTSLPSCVRAGIGREGTPLAVDEHAPYKGGTAFLVVLPNEDDSTRVDAYVVDPSCVRDEGSGPGEVLTRHTYTRR